ncbi:hypothetical protein [Reyranella sp.]|uniref:hypothetical protein n=1 Tax=Reyranella sp. TaxID=1929291 RepID=UPI003F6EB5AA
MSIHIQSRRVFVAGILASLSSAGFAQSAGSASVGTWKGDVPGIGEATLIVTSIGAGGRVEGRMEFALQGFVSTFGDKADSIERTNQGSVADGTLTIEAALGGRYVLRRNGETLNGRYMRGTTMDVPVTFKKS